MTRILYVEDDASPRLTQVALLETLANLPFVVLVDQSPRLTQVALLETPADSLLAILNPQVSTTNPSRFVGNRLNSRVSGAHPDLT